jgi:hypothetical protein
VYDSGGELIFIGLDTFSSLHFVQAMTFALLLAEIAKLDLVMSAAIDARRFTFVMTGIISSLGQRVVPSFRLLTSDNDGADTMALCRLLTSDVVNRADTAV